MTECIIYNSQIAARQFLNKEKWKYENCVLLYVLVINDEGI